MPKAPSHVWSRLRFISQTAIFCLFIYIIWVTKYPLHGFVNPEDLFQLDPLIMGLTSAAEGLLLPDLGLAVLTLLVTFVVGRAFCGWFCPLGAVLDFTGWLTARWRRREPAPPGWLKSKYAVLAGLVLLAVGGMQFAWFFDPLAIFVRTFSFIIHPWINTGTDRTLAWLLQTTHFWPPLDDAYAWLQANFFDIGHPVFPHAGIVGWWFLALLALVLLRRRFWCRFLCPLGALLGLVARFSLLRREANACTHTCGICQNVCRSNAIRPDNGYLPEECVLCLDCVDHCPQDKAWFTFSRPRPPRPAGDAPAGGIDRAQFLLLVAGSLALTTGRAAGAMWTPGRRPVIHPVIRPPAALPEDEFVQRCVRCGNCMKVCLTHVLQPTAGESGWSGIWTPRLVMDLGYCEYQCTLCGQVCPTGAIPRIGVEQKRRTRLGLATVHRETCIPWALQDECLVCEEHCPVATKAIKLLAFTNARGRRIDRPVVDPALCVGCGICQNKCPTRPERAITVNPV